MHPVFCLVKNNRALAVDHFIGDLKKSAIGTIRAFDPRLFTYPANPFIGAGRRIAGFAGLSALETARIDILPAAEQGSKQLYLGNRWRLVCDREAGLP